MNSYSTPVYTYVSLSGAAYLRRSHTVPQSLEKRLELEEETDMYTAVGPPRAQPHVPFKHASPALAST